ncbi:MAG TPA: diacylglycerol kinase family protein [Methylomirabilota bacterium]|nr:diacylglycerol kinase family protein [Methylomirabilota bacterium]
MILVAANPYRGADRPRARVAALTAALRYAGLPPRVVWDGGERAVLLGDPAALAGVRCVVAAGGDGTVAAVINELAADVPLAVLPGGNENVFARALGFGAEPAALASAIAAGRRRRIDLGRARTSTGPRRFGLMLSAGFDADVVHRVARRRTAGGQARRVGRAHYLGPLGAALWAYPHAPVSVTADGVTAAGVHCVISNLPGYALALSLTPAARVDDGLLDWVVFERRGRAALAAYAWAIARARHGALAHVRQGAGPPPHPDRRRAGARAARRRAGGLHAGRGRGAAVGAVDRDGMIGSLSARFTRER